MTEASHRSSSSAHCCRSPSSHCYPSSQDFCSAQPLPPPPPCGRASGSTATPATSWARSSRCSRSASCSALWLLFDRAFSSESLPGTAMVRDARRRAPHHEDLILRSPLSRQRTCAVRSGVSKDEVIQVGIEVQNIEE